MFPPMPSMFRQGLARAVWRGNVGFALQAGWRHPMTCAAWLAEPAAVCPDGNPYPSFRSSPLQGRPAFSPISERPAAQRDDARGFADHDSVPLAQRGILFIGAWPAVLSTAITTPRGNEPCVNILSSSHLRPQPSRAACRPRPSAGSAAPWPVLPSRTRWMRTWLQAQRSALWPVPHPAACRACRPAAATDLTAFGRAATTNTRPSGHSAPVAFVISASRPGRGGRGERCSRRS